MPAAGVSTADGATPAQELRAPSCPSVCPLLFLCLCLSFSLSLSFSFPSSFPCPLSFRFLSFSLVPFLCLSFACHFPFLCLCFAFSLPQRERTLPPGSRTGPRNVDRANALQPQPQPGTAPQRRHKQILQHRPQAAWLYTYKEYTRLESSGRPSVPAKLDAAKRRGLWQAWADLLSEMPGKTSSRNPLRHTFRACHESELQLPEFLELWLFSFQCACRVQKNTFLVLNLHTAGPPFRIIYEAWWVRTPPCPCCLLDIALQEHGRDSGHVAGPSNLQVCLLCFWSPSGAWRRSWQAAGCLHVACCKQAASFFAPRSCSSFLRAFVVPVCSEVLTRELGGFCGGKRAAPTVRPPFVPPPSRSGRPKAQSILLGKIRQSCATIFVLVALYYVPLLPPTYRFFPRDAAVSLPMSLPAAFLPYPLALQFWRTLFRNL